MSDESKRNYLNILIICVLSFAAWTVSASNLQDSAVGTADQLFTALQDGDTAQIEALLDPEVLIFESGKVEASFAEYAAEHMGADMKFMQGVEREIVSRKVVEEGDVAVVTTRAQLAGTYRNRPVEITTNETLLLQRQDAGWRITHVHWSSR